MNLDLQFCDLRLKKKGARVFVEEDSSLRVKNKHTLYIECTRGKNKASRGPKFTKPCKIKDFY